MSVAAASVPTLLKKSLTWSIVLSVLMILAGILAVAVPPIAGIVVTVFVGWLLVFSGGVHLVFAWHARATRAAIWDKSRSGDSLPHSSPCHLFRRGSGAGTYFVFPAPANARVRMAVVRWNHHRDPRHHYLENVAVELRVGAWHPRGYQHDV
jgi:hypothetical protein